MQWLFNRGLLVPNCLDYGCGKRLDAITFGMDAYDPYWYPQQLDLLYKTITCIYVLNVVDIDTEKKIINSMTGLLDHDGSIYIAVRRDVKVGGYKTRNGIQRRVELPYQSIEQNNTFEIYKI
jgi:hypothetical protein